MFKTLTALAFALSLAVPAYAADKWTDASVYPAYGSSGRVENNNDQSRPAETKAPETKKRPARGQARPEAEKQAVQDKAPAETKKRPTRERKPAAERGTAPKTRAPEKKAPAKAAPAADKKSAAEPLVDARAAAGIYVECPRKNPERCPQAQDEFRDIFPNGQPHPYFMIRSDGGGYLATDEKFTTNLTLSSHSPDNMVLKLDDQKKTSIELRRNGEIWRNPKNGQIYILTITDEEWNPAPQPFKNIHKRNKK